MTMLLLSSLMDIDACVWVWCRKNTMANKGVTEVPEWRNDD